MMPQFDHNFATVHPSGGWQCSCLTPCCSLSPPTPRVLLVAPPSMPQLGSLLPSSQVVSAAAQPPSSSSSHQHAARLVSHLAAGALPQVRMVSAQPSVGGPQATLLHQTAHQIRVPVSMGTKGLSQVRNKTSRRGYLFWRGKRHFFNAVLYIPA